jgi:predicted chitinase
MKPLISVDELRRLMPNLSLGKAGFYAPFLNAAMLEQDITSKRRRCAFLAQLAHESAQLRYMEEIASGSAYEGRADLGNVRPGDGRKFKGRGPIQLTGRANYRTFGRLLGLDLENKPELASKPENGFRIAALFWKRKGLNELADQLTMKGDKAERVTFIEITKRINGGDNGLSDRLNYFRIAKQVLHNDEVLSPQPPTETSQLNESVAQAGSPGIVSKEPVAEPEPDLLGATVNSSKAKEVGLKLWPRLVKHSGAALTWLWAFYEANKIGFLIVLLVLMAGALWLLYHNRKKLKPHILRLLK